MNGPKILTADIETLPLETYNWSLFQETRGLDMVAKDWAVFSAAAKWMGKRAVDYRDTRAEAAAGDDLELLRWLRELLDEADIVVGHNAQKFDMRKIRARMIYHGLKPFREPSVVDTMLMAKEVGAFTSNKLEYLAKLANTEKLKHKKYPGFSMWLAVINRDVQAYEECQRYNKQDVTACEKLYVLLRPWARRHPNLAQYFDDEKQRCPRCGHEHMTQTDIIHRGVSTYQAYQCDSCGGHSRSRFTLNSKEKRSNLLTCI